MKYTNNIYIHNSIQNYTLLHVYSNFHGKHEFNLTMLGLNIRQCMRVIQKVLHSPSSLTTLPRHKSYSFHDWSSQSQLHIQSNHVLNSFGYFTIFWHRNNRTYIVNNKNSKRMQYISECANNFAQLDMKI